MRIVEDLLAAQRRPHEESRRITAAVDAALDDAWDRRRYPDPAAAEEAAEAAYQSVVYEIADEKNPRPMIPSEHQEAFADSAVQHTPAFADVEPSPPSVRTDPHFLLSEPAPVAAKTAGDFPETGAAEFADDAFEEDTDSSEEGTDSGEEGTDSGEEGTDVDSDADIEETTTSDPAGTGESDHTTTPLPAAVDLTSPTHRYAAAASEWDQTEELPVSRPCSAAADRDDPDTPADTAPVTPAPSSRSTAPPRGIPMPEPDPEPSLPQRIRETAATSWSQLRGHSSRSRVLVAAAAATLIAVVGATVALTGGRATPPVPAETVAAPVATDNPAPAPTEVVLVPDFVSASCGGDTDPVAPFRGDKSQAWVCNRVNGLDGSVLNITFNNSVVVTRIDVVPGFNYVAPDGRDEWIHHRLVTEVVWRMGGQKFAQQIKPVRTGVSMTFPEVPTKQMSMTITGSAAPPKGAENADGIGKGGSDTTAETDKTTAISSIVIWGRPADPAAG